MQSGETQPGKSSDQVKPAGNNGSIAKGKQYRKKNSETNCDRQKNWGSARKNNYCDSLKTYFRHILDMNEKQKYVIEIHTVLVNIADKMSLARHLKEQKQK